MNILSGLHLSNLPFDFECFPNILSVKLDSPHLSDSASLSLARRLLSSNISRHQRSRTLLNRQLLQLSGWIGHHLMQLSLTRLNSSGMISTVILHSGRDISPTHTSREWIASVDVQRNIDEILSPAFEQHSFINTRMQNTAIDQFIRVPDLCLKHTLIVCIVVILPQPVSYSKRLRNFNRLSTISSDVLPEFIREEPLHEAHGHAILGIMCQAVFKVTTFVRRNLKICPIFCKAGRTKSEWFILDAGITTQPLNYHLTEDSGLKGVSELGNTIVVPVWLEFQVLVTAYSETPGMSELVYHCDGKYELKTQQTRSVVCAGEVQ